MVSLWSWVCSSGCNLVTLSFCLTPFWGSEKRSEKPSISPPENEAHDGVHLLPDLLVRGSGEAFQQGRLFFVESVESLPEIGALATKKIEQYVYQYDNMYICNISSNYQIYQYDNMYIGQSLGNCPVLLDGHQSNDTRDLAWPMTSDVGIPMASYHNHPVDSCRVFHKLSYETIQPLGYHDYRDPNGWWNASSYDQWPSLPSYETPGGMDLPWHGHFFLSDTAADAAGIFSWFKESRVGTMPKHTWPKGQMKTV